MILRKESEFHSKITAIYAHIPEAPAYFSEITIARSVAIVILR
jgi:hypothetical protein